MSNVFRPDLGEYRLNVLKFLQVPEHSSRELVDDLERSVLHRDESGRNAETRNIAGQPILLCRYRPFHEIGTRSHHLLHGGASSSHKRQIACSKLVSDQFRRVAHHP